jgi:hypothetical protein
MVDHFIFSSIPFFRILTYRWQMILAGKPILKGSQEKRGKVGGWSAGYNHRIENRSRRGEK